MTWSRKATLPAASPGLGREGGREAAGKLRLALRLVEELSHGVLAGKAKWVEGKVRQRWGQTGAGGLGCRMGHPHGPARSLSAESWCKPPSRREDLRFREDAQAHLSLTLAASSAMWLWAPGMRGKVYLRSSLDAREHDSQTLTTTRFISTTSLQSQRGKAGPFLSHYY